MALRKRWFSEHSRIDRLKIFDYLLFCGKGKIAIIFVIRFKIFFPSTPKKCGIHNGATKVL